MTTIAYRDGVLASDSRETAYKSRIDTDKAKKIFRVGSCIVGMAGSSAQGMQMLEALKKAVKARKKGEENVLPNIMLKSCMALLVEGDGGLWFYEKGVWMRVDGYYAIGSGSDYAIAAMDTGLSAKEAVRIAINRDCFSGGRIQTLELK